MHAGAPAKPEERDHLERMLRYLLRPPIAESRLRELPDGNILLTQKSKWSDGTTALVFHPLELLERLAAIIPRPQINLLIYHGVLAPNAKWRKRVVGYKRPVVQVEPASDPEGGDAVDPRPERPRYYAWADLMRRTLTATASGRLRRPGCTSAAPRTSSTPLRRATATGSARMQFGSSRRSSRTSACRPNRRLRTPRVRRRRRRRGDRPVAPILSSPTSTSPPSTAEPRYTICVGQRRRLPGARETGVARSAKHVCARVLPAVI